jgi:hypothetical protein
VTATTLTAPEPTAELTPEARRAEATRLWLASGGSMSAAELAAAVDRSDRWARDVIAAARNGCRPAATVAEPAATPPPPAAIVAAALPDVPVRQPARHWGDTLTVLVVALVAAAASYGHMLEVASMAGEPLWLARAFPITVDGLAVAALRRGDEGRRWLALALVVSVAGNVLAQFPEAAATAGPVVSAWPPLALYGTHRLLHGR